MSKLAVWSAVSQLCLKLNPIQTGEADSARTVFGRLYLIR